MSRYKLVHEDAAGNWWQTIMVAEWELCIRKVHAMERQVVDFEHMGNNIWRHIGEKAKYFIYMVSSDVPKSMVPGEMKIPYPS